MSESQLPNSKYWMILLLGSYDPKTEQVLYNLREQITKDFMGLNDVVLVLLLNKIEVYIVDYIDSGTNERKKFTLIFKIYEAKKATLYRLEKSSIAEVQDISLLSESGNVDQDIVNHLKMEYEIEDIVKLEIMEKLDFMGSSAKWFFLLGIEKLTRGGEYVELVYLLEKVNPGKNFFLKKEGFDLSTMTLEILDNQGVY
jgi:hypothetical protein